MHRTDQDAPGNEEGCAQRRANGDDDNDDKRNNSFTCIDST